MHCNAGGENDADANADDIDWDTELTSAALSTAAMSAAAAAAADCHDDGGGWNMSDGETRMLMPPYYSFVS